MTYATLSSVVGLLQVEITASTKPTAVQVSSWIAQVDSTIDSRKLGTATVSGAIFDCPDWNSYNHEPVSTYSSEQDEENEGIMVVPPYTPIVALASGYLYRNLAGPSGAVDWDLLSEGPGDGSDYQVARKINMKTGKYDGYAIWFYNELPVIGKNRIKANITYGYNVDSNILEEYATAVVSKKVLMARLMGGQPATVATYTGGDMGTYVNTQFEVQLKWLTDRIAEIETNYFPKSVAVGVFRG
jgi:hypothetical protein